MKRKAFLLRLPPVIHDALAKWSADELRSLNGHLEFLLSRDLKKAGRWPKSGREEKDES